jgi:hypothetical protein
MLCLRCALGAVPFAQSSLLNAYLQGQISVLFIFVIWLVD